jgi:hypothetical protein
VSVGGEGSIQLARGRDLGCEGPNQDWDQRLEQPAQQAARQPQCDQPDCEFMPPPCVHLAHGRHGLHMYHSSPACVSALVQPNRHLQGGRKDARVGPARFQRCDFDFDVGDYHLLIFSTTLWLGPEWRASRRCCLRVSAASLDVGRSQFAMSQCYFHPETYGRCNAGLEQRLQSPYWPHTPCMDCQIQKHAKAEPVWSEGPQPRCYPKGLNMSRTLTTTVSSCSQFNHFASTHASRAVDACQRRIIDGSFLLPHQAFSLSLSSLPRRLLLSFYPPDFS